MDKKDKTQATANLMQALKDYFAADLTFNLGIPCKQIENHTCDDCAENYSDCHLEEVQVSFDNMKDLKNALINFDSSRGNGFSSVFTDLDGFE